MASQGHPARALRDVPTPEFAPEDRALLTTADGVVQVSLRARRVRPLTAGWHGLAVLPGGLVPGRRTDVVVFAFPDGNYPGYDATAYAITRTGSKARVSHLGWGSRVVRAAHGGFWLDRDEEGPRRVVVRRASDGTPSGARLSLRDDQQLIADAADVGLLVGPRYNHLGTAGEIALLDRDTSRLLHRVTSAGLVLDARGDRLVWVPCAGCAPQATWVDRDGSTRRRRDAALHLGGLGVPVAARVAPNEAHVALVVPGYAEGTWDVAVGHLPDSPDARTVTVALRGLAMAGTGRPPSVSWTPSGRLLVSDGTRLYVVDRAGRSVHAVDVDVPRHREMAAG
ncbi:MAG: hypothetical protein M3Q27_19315 [Actinomycetota bacterium]|nr:hypothetical protein [Actinomycetota bacterium]